jgi:hypothetical protein
MENDVIMEDNAITLTADRSDDWDELYAFARDNIPLIYRALCIYGFRMRKLVLDGLVHKNDPQLSSVIADLDALIGALRIVRNLTPGAKPGTGIAVQSEN